MPHDLETWGFIISVVALVLTIPLGTVAILLAPKVQVWWFLRSIKGTANKLTSLVRHREELRNEPVFTPTETMVFEQLFRLTGAVHFVAYVVGLAVIFAWKYQPHAGFRYANAIFFHYVAPFALPIVFSWAYCGAKARRILMRCSPKEREKVDRQILRLIEKLKAKSPPT